MVKQIVKVKELSRAAVCGAILMAIQGCSAVNNFQCYLDAEGYYHNCDDNMGNYDEAEIVSQTYSSPRPAMKTSTNRGGDIHFKLLDEYSEQLALQLSDGVTTRITSGIAVASFVYLDSSLQTSSALGNQISESLIHELQKLGLPIVDTKVSNMIRVTSTGDFIFSRDPSELTPSQGYEYVLTGTIVREARGVLLQSRIINIHNKQVLTTGTKFIPSLIVGSLES